MIHHSGVRPAGVKRAEALRVLSATLGVVAVSGTQAFAAEPPAASVTPDAALKRLVAGNGRFVAGAMTNQNAVIERRLALTGGQAPFATLLACSDSRVAPELLFDQRVGDLFVTRNAGNFVTDAVLGTMEYGYSVLGVKLIVVLGHESCGAISATYDALKNAAPLPPHLDAIENGIRAGIASVVSSHGTKNAASVANAEAQAVRLSRSSVLGPAIAKGDLHVVAAEYHLGSGRVAFSGLAPLT
jgi:carbonic anhydrase